MRYQGNLDPVPKIHKSISSRAMPVSRSRRIVKCAWISAAVLMLLPVWYVSAWLTVSRAEHDGHISITTAQKIRPAFAPLLDYCESELPASGLLRHIWWSVNPPVVLKTTPSRGRGAFGRIWLIPALSPPRTAAVDETIFAEFPPQATETSPQRKWKLQRKSASDPWIAVEAGDREEHGIAK